MPAVTPDDTELARRATGGDREAFSLLFDRWLDRAFDVAWHILYSREAAADAAQEAFAAAWGQIGSLRQPESFGGWLLRITRNKALNQLAKQRRSSPVGSEEALVTMDPRQADDPTAPLEESEHGDLVWAASAALGEEETSLLNLHLRHDLGPAELAKELGVKPNAVHQRLFRLKKRLADAIAAWVLWRKGDPSCPELQVILARANATSFDSATSKAIMRHAGGCEACVSSRTLRLSPEALFSAMPLVVAGPVLRAKMVAALGDQGVPTAVGPAGGTGSDETTQTDGVSEPDRDVEPSAPDAPRHLDPRAPSGRQRVAVGAGILGVVLIVLLTTLTLLANQTGDGANADDPDELEIATEENEETDSSEGSKAGTSRATSTEADTTTTADGLDDPQSTEPSDRPGAGSPDPVVDGPPTTMATGDSTTTTDPRAPAPEVVRFSATGDALCTSTRLVQVTFIWATSNANAATLAPEDGSASYSVEPSGSWRLCETPGTVWVLTATGPGGSASRKVQVPVVITTPGGIATP